MSEITFVLEYVPDLAEEDKAYGEVRPSLHVYPTHRIGDKIVLPYELLVEQKFQVNCRLIIDFNGIFTTRVHDKHDFWDAYQVLSPVIVNGALVVPTTLGVGVAVYAESTTDGNQSCLVNAGSVNVSLRDALTNPTAIHQVMQVTADPPLIKGKMVFSQFALHGNIPIKFTQSSINPFPNSLGIGLTARQDLEHFAIKESQRVFSDGPLSRPEPDILRRIHCPVFRTPVGDLPGSAYVLMRSAKLSDPAFFEEIFTVALQRYNVTAASVTAIMHRQTASPRTMVRDLPFAMRILAAALSVYATSLVYMKDFVNNNGIHRTKRGAAIGCEDFKVARLFGGDDCEGSALEVMMEFTDLLEIVPPNTPVGVMIAELQQFLQSNVYIPVLGLLGVSNAQQTIDASKLDATSTAAHTVCVLIPTTKIVNRLIECKMSAEIIETPFVQKYLDAPPNWDNELPVLICEGTARTEPLLRPLNTYYQPNQWPAALRRKTCIDAARMALYESDTWPACASLDVPNYVNDSTSHTGDYSPFYKVFGTFYTRFARHARVLDFAWQRKDGTAGMFFNDLVNGGDAEMVFPYNQYSLLNAEVVADTIEQLEPVPALTRHRERIVVVPSELQPLFRLGKVTPDPIHPGEFPLPPTVLSIMLRGADATEANMSALVRTIMAHRSLFSGARVTGHYLADFPMGTAHRKATADAIIYEIVLQCQIGGNKS